MEAKSHWKIWFQHNTQPTLHAAIAQMRKNECHEPAGHIFFPSVLYLFIFSTFDLLFNVYFSYSVLSGELQKAINISFPPSHPTVPTVKHGCKTKHKLCRQAGWCFIYVPIILSIAVYFPAIFRHS